MASSTIQSDSPIVLQEQDKFQRHPFARRIAALIETHFKSDSLTIGIYGKWGEGKTSVLNLIRTELADANNIVCIGFNPWLFSNENQLLLSFFQALGAALKKPLKSKGQKLGDFLNEYSTLLGTIGSLSGIPYTKSILSILGKKLSHKSLEEHRNAINRILEESELKIVIFLDDIDRLNNDEINQIFRLVKLTADFKNTVYVLAFDEDLVAESLSKQYSRNGYEFLEKIIQIPLRLPIAQKSALKNYTINHLNTVLDEYNLNIDQEESYRFVTFFDDHFLPIVTNPRVAARFANSISFSIPLLKGEVNMIDLLVLEGVKVIYPNLYNFIRDYPTLFITNYDKSYGNYDNQQKEKKESTERIDEFLTSFNSSKKISIINLLQDLFPQLKSLYNNYAFTDGNHNEWYSSKRICSGRYFDRYFSYTVIEGEISDVFFDQLLDKLTQESFINRQEELNGILKDLDPEELSFKFQFLEESISQEQSVLLSRNLSLVGELFPSDVQVFSFFSPFRQMAVYIRKLVAKNPEEKRLTLSITILENAQSLDFAWEIWKEMRPKEQDAPGVLTKSQFNSLSDTLLKRCKDTIKFENLFEALDEVNVMFLMNIWADSNSNEIKHQNADLLNIEKTYFLKLLYAYSSTIISSTEPLPYKADFNQEYCDELSRVVDINLMYNKSIEVFGPQKPPEKYDRREKISDDELVGLFQEVHNSNSHSETHN